MDSHRFSRDELAFLIGVPLAWLVLLLFHPGGEGDQVTYAEVRDDVTPWLVVHLGTLLFIPLMGLAVYLLVRGVEGTAAKVTRIGALVFVVFYGAFEAIVGIGTGILVNEVNGLAAGERATGAALVDDYNDSVLVRAFGVLPSIGSLAFIAAMIGAGIALRRHAAAPLSVPILLGISGFLITAHPPPFGPAGLALFIAAVLIYARSQATAPAAAPLTPPPGPVQPSG
jgi:hypothetical protein